jgi:SNF2 family DNA or RNA helicase
MASIVTPEDPYSWTVDQVAYELCHNPQPVWASQAKRALMPASEVFEKAIRENVLDGESFMSMEIPDINSELGVTAFGIKRNIYKVIRFFRSISAEWRKQNIVDHVMPYINGVESPQITTSHLSGRPTSVIYGNQTPLQTQHSPRLSHVLSSTPAYWSHSTPRDGELDQGSKQPITEHDDPAHKFSNLADFAEDSGFQEPSSEARLAKEPEPSPHLHTDGHGLPDSNPEQQRTTGPRSLLNGGNTTTAQAEAEAEPTTQPPTISKVPRRMAPTFVAHIAESRTDQYTPDRPAQLSIERIVDTIIDAEYEFVLTKSTGSAQARKGAASFIRTLLLHSTYASKIHRERQRTREFHHHKDIVKHNRTTSLVEEIENPFLVPEREYPAQEEPKATAAQPDLPADLAYLLARYPPADGDDGYAVFGESGDEGEYDEETWEEIRAEIEENRGKTVTAGMLTEAAVNAAIDKAIAEMIVEWNTKKLAKTQSKGFRMWNKATKDENRAQYIAESTFWFNRFEGAITRLRAAITDGAWLKVADVKGQCRSLEESVFQREEQKYYLAILKLRKAPPRPNQETLSRARNQGRPEVPEGEELLESDPEPSSEDGFNSDDNSDMDSIPHDAPEPKQLQEVEEAINDSELTGSARAEIDTDEMSAGHPKSPVTMSEPSRSIEDSSTDSDDEIRASGRRRPVPRTFYIGVETPSRKPRLPQHFDEPESDSAMDSDLDAPLRLPKSRWRTVGTENEPIELLSSSPPVSDSPARRPSTGSIRTPSLNPETTSTPSSTISRRLTLKLSANDRGPKMDDIDAIQNLEWDTVEDDADSRRALAKAVYELEPEFATKLQAYVKKIAEHRQRSYELLKNAVSVYGEEDDIDHVAIRDQPLARSLGLLFITYNTCMDCMQQPKLSGPILNDTYEAIDGGTREFFTLLARVLKAYCDSGILKKRTGTKRKSNDVENMDELIDDSDILMPGEDQDQDQDQDRENASASASRSAKKRKKKVLQSQEAETQQIDDRLRIAEQELKRATLLQKVKDMVDNAGGDLDTAYLHPVSFNPDAPTIYLDPHIGRKIKPHQDNGIQFMWREITAGKGCMLAHTMGLGKTMQVVSLLITIAQASQSENLDIQCQVPANLQMSRTLILSPPSLVDNWYDEILMWTPPGSLVLGEVRKITAATQPSLRKHNIKHWARDGGVLLMTYPLFKQIVEMTSKKIPEGSRTKYADMLTHKPNIVVADEAHHMKNPKSGLAKAAMKVTTKARIALTGSPLSNHLEEYHQMVDWISPGYLGSIVQFRAKYSEPIKDGLYSDSSSYERRTSARKLLVLKRDLEPKICRADISAIAKDMPNKAEFFITIPLTAVQKDAYSAYAKHMLHDHADGSFKQAKIWSWLSVLSLLLNHPSAFVKKLETQNVQESEAVEAEREASVDTEDLVLPADVPLSAVGLSSEATEDILKAFSTMTQAEREDMHHSYRSLLTARIVKESMRIKEKVLIFSHSIPTLDYLERMLKDLECTYVRIDGKTSMPTRQGMVKEFNNQQDVEVMLISTTAGGLGLNLQGANRVILYDFNFNPTWEEQAVGRAYRLGQKKHVFVYRFRAGGTFEETVYNTSIFKTQLFARVVDKRNPMRYASKNIADYLFPPREVEQADLNECVGKDPEILDRIMEEETCIRNVELTETFQVEEDDELTPEELRQADQEYHDEVLARTDPAELARVIYERNRAQKAAIPDSYMQSSAPRVPVPQRPASTQLKQMANNRLSSELQYAGSAVSAQTPHVQFGAYDDMVLNQRPETSRGRANSVPRRLSQMDYSGDGPLECTPQ